MNYIAVSNSLDGYQNLARDEHLLNTLAPRDRALFLYVNARAVIIGRNQNPWRECNLTHMEIDGVQLVRRVSGGGAVYHDEGNLNFSFVCSKELYNEREQTQIVLGALKSLGICAQPTGRNDIAIGDKKISGNAYCERAHNKQRHGTLLINSELDKFDRYLSAPKLKLNAKGVQSVRARVCNISEYKPGLTTAEVADALKRAYAHKYGEVNEYVFTQGDKAIISARAQALQCWDWLMGEAPKFDFELEHRFEWGMAQLCLRVEHGRVISAKLYTDSLDENLPAHIESLCEGARFSTADIAQSLERGGAQAQQIAAHLRASRIIP